MIAREGRHPHPPVGRRSPCSAPSPAITAFLEAESVEAAIRNAVSLGGDADTQACMAGGMAEAFHGGLPEELRRETLARLTPELRAVVEAFEARFLLT